MPKFVDEDHQADAHEHPGPQPCSAQQRGEKTGVVGRCQERDDVHAVKQRHEFRWIGASERGSEREYGYESWMVSAIFWARRRDHSSNCRSRSRPGADSWLCSSRVCLHNQAMSVKRILPLRNRGTATSLAPLSTTPAVPPTRATSKPSSRAGNRSGSTGSKLISQLRPRSNIGAGQGNRLGYVS